MNSLLQRLALFAAAALAGCGESGGASGSPGGGRWGGKKDGAPAEAVPVRTDTLRRGWIALRLQTTATVDPVRRVDLVPKGSGIVKTVPVVEGALVAAGDILATFDDAELLLARKKAEVNEAKTRSDLDQMKTLLEEKFVSLDEYRKAEQAWRTAQLELESTVLAVDHATFRAPIAGTVTKLDVQVGKYVTSNANLGEITDLSELECTIHVPEKDVLRLRQSQEAEVSSESLGSSFKSTVRRVNPVIDRGSGTARAVLTIADPDRALRPGMFVDVSIVLEPHPDALLVPKKALVYDEGRPGVFLKKGGEAKWLELELGFQEKDVAEVLKGASEGDEIVIVGQNGLKDGTRIRVMADQAP